MEQIYKIVGTYKNYYYKIKRKPDVIPENPTNNQSSINNGLNLDF